jgi:sugar lactone lactonase YvrE
MKTNFPILLAVAWCAGFQQCSAQIFTPYTIVTVAGLTQFDQYGNPVGGSADGTGSAARFSEPRAVAVDTNGNVYIADTYNSTIRMMTPGGVVTTLAGTASSTGSSDGTNGNARFNWPNGITVDTNGNIYVADGENKTIRKVTPVGTNWVVTTLAGLAGTSGTNDGIGTNARFNFFVLSPPNSASGMAVDVNGNLYVADNGSSTIRKITAVGTNWQVMTLAGMPTVIGTNNGTGSGAQFFFPQGVAVDTNGNVYVADLAGTVRKVTPAGAVTTLAGQPYVANGSDGQGTQATFSDPNGIAIDSSGNLYVTEYYCKIRRVTLSGYVTTVAGLNPPPGVGYLQGNQDGTGDAAGFWYPVGIAADAFGNLYVSDTYNNEIRKGYPENAPAQIGSSTQAPGFTNGHFGFTITAPAGQLAVVQVSTNMISWQPVWTNLFPGTGTNYTTLSFNDPQSNPQANRFYRVRTP